MNWKPNHQNCLILWNRTIRDKCCNLEDHDHDRAGYSMPPRRIQKHSQVVYKGNFCCCLVVPIIISYLNNLFHNSSSTYLSTCCDGWVRRPRITASKYVWSCVIFVASKNVSLIAYELSISPLSLYNLMWTPRNRKWELSKFLSFPFPYSLLNHSLNERMSHAEGRSREFIAYWPAAGQISAVVGKESIRQWS